MSASSDALYRSLPWDDRRGTGSVYLFIATEAFLFISLFFTYFYLGANAPRWPLDEPPKLLLASIMLVVLVLSSVVAMFADHAARHGKHGRARALLALTILMGVGFLVLQFFEYRDHLRKLRPTADAYASIFYTLTSVHALHVIVGLCMLGYVLVLPTLEPTDKPPHRPVRNATLYWHFVDTVWVFLVVLIYYVPHLQ